MIEVEIARSGAKVIKRDGKFLASAFDPVQEAGRWADKMHAETGSHTPVIVAGLGCGYHVAALKALQPDREILAIDNCAEMAEQALRLCPSLEPKNILIESDWLKLADHDRFRDLACGVYAIGVHAPSLQIDPTYFAAVVRLLRGRDKLSFLVLLKTRPELLALFEPAAIGAIGDEPISIKTIRGLFSAAGSSSRERRLWRMLEELVV